jgi:hypothetical protein
MTNPRTQVFAPVGGMNQDDSVVSPTPNYAGHNAFGQGDYRYALNSQIGSSKSDNFGDLEIIKGTTEVTGYKVRSQLFSNSTFLVSLTGWSLIDVNSGNWAWNIGAGLGSARIPAACDDIIYQALSLTVGKTYGLALRFMDVGSSTTFTSLLFYVKYLQGTTVLSSELVYALGDGQSVNTQITIPANCDGIGFQCISTYSGVQPSLTMVSAKIYGWASGARPSGTEKVVGQLENKEHQRLYYAVYNSAGNHCIRYYDPADSAVYELLKWSGLSYTSTRFVKLAMIDNWLATTDRENSPRLMDVDTITDLFVQVGSSSFREYHISFHKWAPVMPPRISAYYDGAINNYDRFEDKVYQWSYRYIYKGRLKSRWSPVSVAQQSFMANSGNELTHILIEIPGFNLDVPGAATQYNYFGNDNSKFIGAVEFIEIAYREGANDLWRMFKRFEVSDDNTSFDFDGEISNSTPIPDDDFYQPFDTVPFQAGTVEAVDNRFVFADIIEEHDAAATPIITDVGIATYDGSMSLASLWNDGYSDPADNATQYSGLSAGDADILGNLSRLNTNTFKGRGLYKLGIQYFSATGWKSAVYTADEWMYRITEESGTIDKIYALMFKLAPSFRPPEWAVAYQIVRTNCLNIDYFMFGLVNAFEPVIDNTTEPTDIASAAVTMRDRIRQHMENARLVTGLDYDKYLATLFNKPIAKSVLPDIRSTATAALADASRVYININNWYNSSKKNAGGTQNNPLNNLYYNYREGDRVRFMASTNATPTDEQKVVYDEEILEFTGRGIVVKKPAGILWLPADAAGTDGKDFVIEVYTPKIPKKDDYLYYETGEWYPILYPGTDTREFAKRDWTFTNAGAITGTTYGDIKVFNKKPFSFGDCHAFTKTFYYNIKTTVTGATSNIIKSASMNQDPEKTYDFWDKCTGRSAASYTDLPIAKFKPTQFRFGGEIVEESFVNQINRFKDADQKIFPSEYGRIRNVVATANAQVESVGTILLAIGERETFSIYVNRTTLEDLSGRTQVTLSDKRLGSYNTLLGSHGTFNPESVSVHRGRVWYWDAINGTWVRYGRDGLTAISKYKMRNWFKELGKLMMNEYNTDDVPMAISGFDPFHESLVTYQNHTDLPATFRDYTTYKGAIFSEDDTRWKSIHSLSPEMFGKMNDEFISFKAGGVYTHETNSLYSTFYGTKYDVKIEPVFNGPLPKDVKSWQTFATVSSHKWSVERFLSEYRGAKTKQQSVLTLAEMIEKEDGYYAPIKNDQNTPVVSSPLIEGNKMRSKALRALMTLDPSITTLSLLHYVEVGDINSPKNP